MPLTTTGVVVSGTLNGDLIELNDEINEPQVLAFSPPFFTSNKPPSIAFHTDNAVVIVLFLSSPKNFTVIL